MGWTRSDRIAGFAVLLAGFSLLLQFLDRDVPLNVQAYIDQTQASGRIVDATEQLINARQLAMISVDWNVYEPEWAKLMTMEQMILDSKKAEPVIIAKGNFVSALQTGQRFYKNPESIAALTALNNQADIASKCFTDIASARRKVSPHQEEKFRSAIVNSCAGANIEGSLDNLKMAEATAMIAMDKERDEGD